MAQSLEKQAIWIKVLLASLFVLIAVYLFMQNWGAHCLNSTHVNGIQWSFGPEENTYIPNCRSSRIRPLVLKQKISQYYKQIQEKLLFIEKSRPHQFKERIKTELVLYSSPSPMSHSWSLRKIEMPLDSVFDNMNLERSLMWQEFVNKLNSHQKFSDLNRSEVQVQLLGDFLATIVVATWQPRSLEAFPFYGAKSGADICQLAKYSLFLQLKCAQGELLSSEIQDQLRMQVFVAGQVIMALRELSPYQRLKISLGFLGHLNKFESAVQFETAFPEWVQSLNNSELQWGKALIALLTQNMAADQWRELHRFMPQRGRGHLSRMLILNQFESDLEGGEPLRVQKDWYVRFKEDVNPNFSRTALGKIQLLPHQDFREVVMTTCGPPTLKELNALQGSIQKIYILISCQPLRIDQIEAIQFVGIEGYLKKNREQSYFLVHLPSIKMYGEKEMINPFAILEQGDWKHPVFKKLGWLDIELDQEAQHFNVRASIEAIQRFRLVPR